MHEFDFDNLMLQHETNSTANIETSNKNNNNNNDNNVNSDHSDDSSSANEKEYPEEEEEEEEIEETYFLKQNQQLTAQSILDKINIMQEERSINGTDSITLVTNDNHLENINNNNNINSSSHIIESNLLSSSKTTSSVSSSTSISSNGELSGDRGEAAEETTSVTSNNENESQPIPVQDSSSFLSTSMTHIQNDLFESDANINETRFDPLDCIFY